MLIGYFDIIDLSCKSRNATRTTSNPSFLRASFVPRANGLGSSTIYGVLFEHLFHGLSLEQNRESPTIFVEPNTSTHVCTQSLFFFSSILLQLFFHCLRTQPTHPLPIELLTHTIYVLRCALLTHPTALTLGILNLRYRRQLQLIDLFFRQLKRYVWDRSLKVLRCKLRWLWHVAFPWERAGQRLSMGCHGRWRTIRNL